MRKFSFLFVVIVFGFQLGISQEADAILKDANILFKSGKTLKAIEKFESLGEHSSSDIYYNLGRIYQENGNIAKAALNYERALKIDKRHNEANNNLSIIREETDFDIIPVEEMFLIRWWKALAGILSANLWMFISLIMAVLIVVSLYYWWIANVPGLKKRAFLASIVSPILLLIIIALGATSKALSTNSDFAIIMDADFDMHEGADERSPIVKNVEAGTKVKIVDQIDDWVKVVTADTESGWLKKSEVETI